MFPALHLRCLRTPLFAIALSAGSGQLFANDTQAENLLKQGRADEATHVLQESLASRASDSTAHLLLCRVYYSEDLGSSAAHECEMAASGDPTNSDYQLWLGKAYGLQASQANMLSAFSIAKKVRTAFERAVQLDPANVAALSALGQFYVEAPGIVGGGLDKAQALVPQLQTQSPAKAARLLALIANKKKDFATAEVQFKNAAAIGRTPEAYVDLAQFYQERGDPEKAMAAIETSIELNRTKNSALVDAASILAAMHRSPDLAERVLREYLASGAKSEDAPAFKVHVQLGDLLMQQGNAEGARGEYSAALALASRYTPARKAMQGT